MSLELRPYQVEIVDKARALILAGHKKILICAPTGSGKTALTAHMIGSAVQKKMESWFIVHRRELVKQSMLAFDKADVYHGIIASKFPADPRAHAHVCSIQSLARRIGKVKEPRMIIWDECHHIGAASWEKIFLEFPGAIHIGVTATPQRLDGKGLEKYFDHMIMGPSVSWLIENEYLVPYRLFKPAGGVSMEGVHTQMGDFKKAEALAKVNNSVITGSALREYKKFGTEKRAVVFCLSVKHSKDVVEEFIAGGISARHVDAESSADERDEAVKLFSEGKIKVLSNVDLFGEGFDLPAIEIVILLRPTQSLGLYLQQVGRALRIFPGKKEAIILDHVGNVDRHGLPDEDRQWSLAGRQKKKGKQENNSVKTCDNCFAAQLPGAKVCFNCGHTFAAQQREVKEVEGDLEEIKKEEFKKQRKAERAGAKSLEELVALGKARGYKPGWAQHVWNSRGNK